jgi:hypothetical protein
MEKTSRLNTGNIETATPDLWVKLSQKLWNNAPPKMAPPIAMNPCFGTARSCPHAAMKSACGLGSRRVIRRKLSLNIKQSAHPMGTDMQSAPSPVWANEATPNARTK